MDRLTYAGFPSAPRSELFRGDLVMAHPEQAYRQAISAHGRITGKRETT